MYQKQNKIMKDALNKENIKALRYFNEHDAGLNWRDIENISSNEEMNNLISSDMVKPDFSYIIFDSLNIEAK